MTTVASRKAKGRKLQQWVRDRILENHPALTLDDVRSTSGGVQGEDIQLSSKAKELIPFQFECKNLSRVSIYKHYEQAISHGDRVPVVVIKQDRSKPLVIIDAEYFLREFT